MAPAVAMADIAFNLVLFFLIMARQQDESSIKPNYASVPTVRDLGQSRVSVIVRPEVEKDRTEYKVYLNARKLNSVSDLTDDIKKLLEGLSPGLRTVLLKIDKNTPAATFEKVIEAVSQADGEVMHVLEKDQNE